MDAKTLYLVALISVAALLIPGCCCCIPPTPPGPTPTPIPVPTGTPYVPAGAAKWTYIVYLDGDNNLEEAAIADFLEMEKVGSNSDINIVVQMDRSAGYYSGEGDWSGARRFLVQHGDGNSMVSPYVQDLGSTDMSSPDSLYDFFSWAVDNYPAQKYALVLWNHGGGWTGLLQDEGAGTSMHNPELKQVLERMDGKLGRKLDLAVFDMCLMAQYEVAIDVAPYADYMVASEETVPGWSFDYSTVLGALAANPSMSSREFATTEVQKFQEFYSSKDDATTMSALDLSKIPALKSAYDDFAGALTSHVNSGKWNDVADMHMYTENYPEGMAPEEMRAFSFGDLYDFASNAEAYSGSDPALGQKAQALESAINDLIILNYNHPKHPRSHGISYYFQPSKDIFDRVLTSEYERTTAYNDPAWKGFLEAYYSSAPETVDPPRIADFAASRNASLTRPLKFSYTMSGQDIVSNRWAQFYQDGGQWKLSRVINQRTSTTLSNGKQVYGFPGGTGDAFGTSSTVEMLLSDGTSSVRASVEQLWPAENFYAIDGLLEKGSGEQADSRLYFYDSNGTLGRIQVISVSTSGERYVSYLPSLDVGDQFTPYTYTLGQGGLTPQSSGHTLTYNSQHGFSVSWHPLQAGDYMVADILTDLRNQTNYSSTTVHVGTQPTFTPLQQADLSKKWECGQIEEGMRVQRLMVLDFTSGCRFEDIVGNATCEPTYDSVASNLFISLPARFETYKFFASRMNDSAFWLFSSTAGDDPVYCALAGGGRPSIQVYRDLYHSVGDSGSDLDEQRTDAACVLGEWESTAAGMNVNVIDSSHVEITISNYTVSGTYTIENSTLHVSSTGMEFTFYYLCSDHKFVLYDMANSPAIVLNKPGHPLPAAPNDPVVASGQQPPPQASVPPELVGTWANPIAGVVLFLSDTGFFTLTDGSYYYYGTYTADGSTLTLSTGGTILSYTYELSDGTLTVTGNGQTMTFMKMS